jgi:hypothetical protein
MLTFENVDCIEILNESKEIWMYNGNEMVVTLQFGSNRNKEFEDAKNKLRGKYNVTYEN